MAGKTQAAKEIAAASEDVFAELLKKARKASEEIESEFQKLLKKKPQAKPEPKPETKTVPRIPGTDKKDEEEDDSSSNRVLTFAAAMDAVRQVLNGDYSQVLKDEIRKREKAKSAPMRLWEQIDGFGKFYFGEGKDVGSQVSLIKFAMEKKLLPQTAPRRTITSLHRTRVGKGQGAGL